MLRNLFFGFLIGSSRLLKKNETLKHVRNVKCNDQTAYKGGGKQDMFFTSLTKRQKSVSKNKITVVGVGQVGMACVLSCLTNGLSTELCLYDIDMKKSKGEAMDLQHGAMFFGGPRITAANDISETANSKLIIVTAGAKQNPEEGRPALMGRNLEIMKSIIPTLAKNSPDAIFIIVTNPVDAITYAVWKLSEFPFQRVLGSGTNLDTSRFRYFISERMNISVMNAHGYIIGEHGDTSVPVWSGVNIGGVALREDLPQDEKHKDPTNWEELHKRTVKAAYDVIALKGYTSWAIGYSVGQLSGAIMRNTLSIHAVTTNLKGLYGVDDEVFASVPCVLGETGIQSVVQIPLTKFENELLLKSVDAIRTVMSKADI